MCSLQFSQAQKNPASSGRVPVAHMLSGLPLYVASNRGPVHYRLHNDELVSAPAAGGLATALSDVATQVPLTWIATANGPADLLAAKHLATVAARRGLPRLRFVAASEETLNWFYWRFANPILWFLQHGMWGQLRRQGLREMIEKGWILGYRPVNEAFASEVAREIRGSARPIVLTHDYHLYLLPGLVRRRAPQALVQHFTHIPWPGPDAWEPLLPAVRREICRGLLGADIVGFQTHSSVSNFLRCCDEFVVEAHVDYSERKVLLGGRAVRVRSYPISVDAGALRRLAASRDSVAHKQRLRPLLGAKTIVRVDRLDPSKNVDLGFKAFGLLLERHPELVGQVRFLAFLVPSRETIVEYRRHAKDVWREVEAVNNRFGQNGWKPIEVFYEDNRPQAVAGMALADVLLVNSTADGMNLVAKEGPMVSERDLVLVLSNACGAHAQLGKFALSVSPEDVSGTATALERALRMPRTERAARIAGLRAAIESQDLSWWVHRQIEDLVGY